MKHTIGFIGGGNMGRAMMEGLISSGLYKPEEIFVYDVYQPILESLQKELNVQPISDLQQLVAESGTVIVSVKPNVLASVLTSVKDVITADQLIVSIAAGITLDQLTELLSNQHKLVRVMPNTPALVGEGMSAIAANDQLTEDERQLVYDIFSSFGQAEFVAEYLIDAVVGVSGSGPAYVYMFIEALADGAVLEGMPRAMAYKMAAQVVYGSAKMVMETGKHPGELKDMVCSPGGTTIEAVKVLEENQFRGIVMKTVQAAAQKNREL